MSNHACESCGMPIETGTYCPYCVDEKGKLQPFEERFERMVQWQGKREPSASRAELEKKTLAYMATMPAWKDHPRVRQGQCSMSGPRDAGSDSGGADAGTDSGGADARPG